MTMYWHGDNAKAVVVIIPGGDGYIGLTNESTDLTKSWVESVKRLTKSEYTRGQVDLVMLDSPSPVNNSDRDLSGRGTKGHMVRIESVVKFYKEKTGLPVIILAQSNGGVSLANFFRYMQDKQETDLIAGAIASTTRPESYFPKNINVPILFITHKNDGCRSISQLHGIYEQVSENNSALTEWILVEGGESESGKSVCYSGYHMFYKAGEEYANGMDEFINKVIKE